MAAVKASLDRSVIQLKDLSEQPHTDHVLILSGTGAIPDTVVAVDSWDARPSSVTGFRRNGYSALEVIAFNPKLPWAVLHRTVFIEMKREDAIRQVAKDENALQDLHAELNREAATLLKKARRVEELQLDRTLEAMEPGTERPGNYL